MDISKKPTDQLEAELLVLNRQADKLRDNNPESPLLAECENVCNDIAAELHKRNPARPLTVDGIGNQANPPTKLYALTAEGQRMPIFGRTEKMAPAGTADEGWLGEFVRNSLGIGGRKIQNSILESGAATVPTSVSSRIFDFVRAKSRLVQAGALTLPINLPTNFLKVTGDATIYQHTEATDDIQESVPVFAPIQANPGTLACLVPVSLELVADSPNLDQALAAALGGAFALKADAIGITALLADTNLNISQSGNDTETWPGTLAAVGAALAANMDQPTAMICAPADWTARHGQRWDASTDPGGDGGWLGAPGVLQGMADLPTTSMTAGHALLGGFDKGVALVVRQDLRLEMIRWGKPGHGSHILAAHSRMQFYTVQPKALFHQKKTV